MGRWRCWAGTVSGAYVAGLLQVLGGAAEAVRIGSGGNVFLNSGTLLSCTIYAGGSQTVEYSSVTDTIISSGGIQDLSGSAMYTTVMSGGLQYVGFYGHARTR